MRRIKDIYGKRLFKFSKKKSFCHPFRSPVIYVDLLWKKDNHIIPLYTEEDLQAAHEFQEMNEQAASDKEN